MAASEELHAPLQAQTPTLTSALLAALLSYAASAEQNLSLRSIERLAHRLF